MTENRTIIIAEPGKQEVFNIREFDAPRELVFRAFVEPDLYRQWYGPGRQTMSIETFDPKNGGSWRYTLRDREGSEYAFHGVYHEVTAPERIIETVEFEGLREKGHAILRTTKFEVLPDNRTRLTVHLVSQSVADRDGMLQPGYEEDLNESYQRLDAVLETMKK